MKKSLIGKLLFCCFLFLLTATSVYAGSAEVLPKGVFRGEVEYGLYFPIDTRFDPDGSEENVAADYNARLDSSVFSSLADLESGFGLAPGSASLGESVVDFEYQFNDLILNFHYGLTDRLSVGIKIPYYWNKTDVKQASVDTTNATVGINPLFGTPGDPFGVPVIPLAFGGVADNALATELAQSQLEELGYARIGTWSGSGISDIEAGLRYQYFKSEDWRLAFTGGIRLPTGEVDDPDNLVDVGFGTGAWALLFRLNNDYTAVKNLILNFTLKYDLVLPDKETLRVPDSVNQPITANKEKVDRDIGDIIRLEFEASYQILEPLSLSLLYEYGLKFKDKVSGNKGFRYESLEEETDWTYHRFEGGLSYSTIPNYMSKKFPVPLTFIVSYETFFGGTNKFLKQDIIWLRMELYF